MHDFFGWALLLIVTLVMWVGLGGFPRQVRVLYLLVVLAGLVGTWLLMPSMLCAC